MTAPTPDPRTRVVEALARAESASRAQGGGPARLKETVTAEMTALITQIETEARELVSRANGAVAWAVRCAYDDARIGVMELGKPIASDDKEKEAKQKRNQILEEALNTVTQRRDDALRGAVETKPPEKTNES